jgi:UDP-glucose 4-epimerase
VRTKNILVTGGAGYIGSVCCAQLVARGYSVVVLDDLSTGFADALPQGTVLHRVGIGDRSKVRRILADHPVDVVFHFAAKALIAESVKDPGIFFDSNVASGIALLEELRRAHVRKFVFSSSAAVYGNCESSPIAEDHPKAPITSYGESKLMFEQILAWYARAYGWGIAAMRYFNAGGASAGMGERHDPETHLIPRLFQAASGDVPVFEVFGGDYPTPDGSCLRDYVHVLDIAESHIRTMPLLDKPGMTPFNIGTGTSHSVKQVVRVAEMVCGLPIPTRLRGRRPGDPAVLCASPERLFRTLGWRPEHSDLTNIMQTAWEFHQSSRRSIPTNGRHASAMAFSAGTSVQRDKVL